MDRPELPAPDGRRFTPLTDATMTTRRREVHDGIVSGPRKGAALAQAALSRGGR